MMRTTPPAPHRLNHRGGIGSIRGRARHRHHHRRRPATETDASGTPSSSTDEVPVPVRLLAIVGASSPSHFGYPALLSRPPPTWLEVFSHARDLLRWTDSAYVLDVAEDDDFDVLDDIESRNTYDIVVCVDARAEIAAAAAESVARHGGTSLLSLGEASTSPAVLRLRDSRSPAGTTGNILSFLRSLVLEPRGGLGRRQSALLSSAAELWKRRSADDLVYLLLVLIDALAREVPRVSMTASASPTPDLLYCMLTNCGREVIDCVSDPTCKAALDCLTDCGLNDQVCSYQCIVAYETPLFERFSQCVLQKHNCMGNFAEVPDMPAVDPMTRFRGAEMTHEQAEDILIGWLGEERHSWKVVTGQNAAYDVFPNQHQVSPHPTTLSLSLSLSQSLRSSSIPESCLTNSHHPIRSSTGERESGASGTTPCSRRRPSRAIWSGGGATTGSGGGRSRERSTSVFWTMG